MPTADRTTLPATVSALITKLRDNLVADPPTAAKPFRRIEADGEYARPFCTLTLAGFRPIGTVDNDKLFEASIVLRVVTDVVASDPLSAVLNKVTAIEDYLDGIIDTGVIEGAEGFDDRVWSFEYPSAGARMAVATATQTFIVKVERGNNRVPAT